MSTSEAVALLAKLGEGDTSEYGKAIAVVVARLTPKPRKVKVDPNLAAFLKIRFPHSLEDWHRVPSNLRDLDAKLSPAARAQFAYGRPKARKYPDAAILAGARA